jgi:NADH:quinone reductase (non-electrogenic)
MGARPHHVVIIGAGFGGLSAVRKMNSLQGDITIIDKRNFHLFQPLLYQAATGLLCTSEITPPLRHILRHQKNAQVLLGEVVDFDPSNKRVILADGEIEYDTLIVAAGMINHYFGHDEWAKYAPGLKTIEDTAEIRQRIFYAFEVAERETDPALRREWLTFIVVGGGATGIELSGMLAEIAKNTLKDEFRSIRPEESQIILLDAENRILPAYPAELSEKAEISLTRLGVKTYTDAKVMNIDEKGIMMVHQGRNEFLPSRNIFWATGVRASPLGQKLAEKTGAEIDSQGRIIVKTDLTIAGHPEIFVIGDLAHYEAKDGRPLYGLAPVATQQGRYVAKIIRDRLAGKTAIKPFKYFDKGTLAVIGRNAAVADIGRLHFGGYFAWFLWLFIHLILLINFENRIVVLIRWAFQYFSSSHGARQLAIKGSLRLPITLKGKTQKAE